MNNTRIPSFLPPIPKGYVYLGASRNFRTTSRLFKGGFIAELSANRGKTWNLSNVCCPSNTKIHYIAKENSAIAKLNTSSEQEIEKSTWVTLISSETEKANQLIGKTVRHKTNGTTMKVNSWSLHSPTIHHKFYRITLQGTTSLLLNEVEEVTTIKIGDWNATEIHNNYNFSKVGEMDRQIPKSQLKKIKELMIAEPDYSSVSYLGLSFDRNTIRKLNLEP